MTDNLPPLLPCPFCGGEPALIARPDNIDGTEFICSVACYCGGYSASAHKMERRQTPEQAKADTTAAWNRRAAIAQAQSCVPALWAIHVPGPDDYYPAPSEEAANHMVSKHNAAMTEWNKANPDTSGNRPPIESSLASAKPWPGSEADHAEEIAVFDYAAWGLASPQPQPAAHGDHALVDWRIDHSAGRPILVYKDCSVLESDQAYYVLELLKSALSSTQPQPVQPSERWHVGDSAFESWFSDYSPAGKGDKQRARDAYAAGMGELLQVAQAKPEQAAQPKARTPKQLADDAVEDSKFYFNPREALTPMPKPIAAPQPKD